MPPERRVAPDCSAEEAERRADLRRLQAEQVVAQMVRVFRMANPDEHRDGRTVTVNESLARGVRQLERELGDRPLVRAELLYAIGETYLGLAMAAEAEPIFRQVIEIRAAELGEDHGDTLDARGRLAVALHDLGQNEQAFALFKATAETQQRLFGGDCSANPANAGEPGSGVSGRGAIRLRE